MHMPDLTLTSREAEAKARYDGTAKCAQLQLKPCTQGMCSESHVGLRAPLLCGGTGAELLYLLHMVAVALETRDPHGVLGLQAPACRLSSRVAHRYALPRIDLELPRTRPLNNNIVPSGLLITDIPGHVILGPGACSPRFLVHPRRKSSVLSRQSSVVKRQAPRRFANLCLCNNIKISNIKYHGRTDRHDSP